MKTSMQRILIPLFFVATFAVIDCPVFAQWKPVPLKRTIDSVAPWTGIVLWADHDKNETDAIQLEYRYMRYDKVVVKQGEYDWSHVDDVLDDVASRGHQAILRFYFVYPGNPTAVPEFIKQKNGYTEITGKCEGQKTSFVDWSHPAIPLFMLDFYSAFSKRYDTDPRLAYLQTGFGLWGEYHIYDGPLVGKQTLGKTFPSKAFQAKFLKHLDAAFDQTPWMISIDAADGEYSPFEDQQNLLKTSFGLFDDSFLCKPHPKENALNWRFFGDQWKHSPAGGEFSYYTDRDQKKALSAAGPNGRSFEDSAAEFHVSFMIGSDQPEYQPMHRIRKAGMATGYRLRVTKFEVTETASRVTITNVGIAPPYYDAYVTIADQRARQSLRGLLPGESRTFKIPKRAAPARLTIESDRLVKGQQIPFEADLK